MTVLMLAGACIGLGVAMMIAGLRPPAPDLAAGVARMTGAVPAPGLAGRRGADRLLSSTATGVVEFLHLDRHAADLALTGTTATRLALEKLGYAALGLAFPLLLTAMSAVAGLTLPLMVPTTAAVMLAVVLSFMPEVELHRRATLARDQMRRTVCSYLELVALERAADAGAVEALERAAAIGDGAGFEHIRAALLRARLEGRTPWQQLSALAEQVGVAELGDVADIMRLSGEDGAAVLPTLRARSASLRTWLLQSEVTRANEASERMSIPVALLGVAFMALLGFPAFARILFG